MELGQGQLGVFRRLFLFFLSVAFLTNWCVGLTPPNGKQMALAWALGIFALETPSMTRAVEESLAAGVPPGSAKCPGSQLPPGKVDASSGESLEYQEHTWTVSYPVTSPLWDNSPFSKAGGVIT